MVEILICFSKFLPAYLHSFLPCGLIASEKKNKKKKLNRQKQGYMKAIVFKLSIAKNHDKFATFLISIEIWNLLYCR